MGFQQLGPLVDETALPGDETLPVDDVALSESSDLFEDDLLRLESEVAAQLNAGVVALNRALDVVDAERPLDAAGGVSLPADADEVGVDLAVNKSVKFREWWRPFAPSILAEHMEEYFGTKCPSPFMILAFQARDEVKSRIPATLHVDGTGRPQTVDRDTNPRYWHLINEFKKLTGVPVLLNTSFNVDSEPIVCTPRNALATFYMCGLDALAIGDFLVEKRPSEG